MIKYLHLRPNFKKSLRFLVMAGCLIAPALVWAQPPARAELEPAGLEASANELQALITEAVAQAGGDLETEQVHIVFGFSTGHFDADPNLATAAREIAWRVVDDLLIEGDKVSVYAWEMELWDHLNGQSRTVTLSGSGEGAKASVKDLWPLTPRAGSIGGHDTELAIVSLADRVSPRKDAVIVLLTNDATSIAARGAQLIGENNPRYVEVLSNWTRLSSTNNTGATLEADVPVVMPNGERVPRKLDVVVLVPNDFTAASLDGTRSGILAAAGTSGDSLEVTNASLQGGAAGLSWLWWTLGIVVVAAGAFFGFRGLNKAKSPPQQGESQAQEQ